MNTMPDMKLPNEPIDLDRCYAESDRQRGITRRGRALLAAAGMEAPEKRWFVLTVAAGREAAVDGSLDRAGVGRWMPTEKPLRRSRYGGSREPVERPALRGYLFVRVMPLADHWQGIMTVDGVLGVLGGWERPWPVAEHEIGALRRFFGLPPRERQREIARRRQATAPIAAGDRVTVTAGPLEFMTGEVERCGELSMRVVLDLFGGRVPVSIPLANLSKSA